MPTQQEINQLIANDPEIQRVIKGVWGDTTVHQRPSDTPKHLEKANDRASKEIKRILEGRGIKLPSRSFINPRSASVEGMRGWAGLPTAAKIGIIGGAAAGGLGLAGMLPGLGGAAAGGGTAATGGTLASTPLATSAALPFAGGAGNLAGGIAGLTGAAGATTGGTVAGGGIMSKLLGAGKKILGIGGGGKAGGGGFVDRLLSPEGLKTIGTGIGAISGTQAHNRGTALDAMMEADQMGILAGRDRRDDEAHMMKMLQAANYIKSGGMKKQPRMSSSGMELPSFGFGPPPISEADKGMASALEQQLMQRLSNPPQLRNYDSKMEPGKIESLLNYAGPALTGLGAIKAGAPPMPKPPMPQIPQLKVNSGLTTMPGQYLGDE